MKKTWFRISIIFFLTFIFLYFFFRSVEWKEVFSYLTKINLKFFVLIVILVPLHLVTRAIRWHYLLRHEKKGVSFYNRFAANAIGFTVTLIFPGRLGELIKPLFLAQKENMRKGFVVGTVVVERTFDIFTMCALLGIFIVSRPLYAPIFQVNEETYSNLQLWGIIGVAFASLILIVALALYFFREKTLSIIAFFLKPLPQKLSQRILKFIKEFIQGLKFFHSIKDFLLYTLFSFVVWLGIIGYYWVFFYVYDSPIFFFFLFPYVFLVMVGASIPTPGMVGGFHYFSKLGLTSLYGIDVNLAFVMTVVVHAVQVVVTCLCGYAILWKEGISLFQIKKLGSDTEQ